MELGAFQRTKYHLILSQAAEFEFAHLRVFAPLKHGDLLAVVDHMTLVEIYQLVEGDFSKHLHTP